MRSSRGFTLIEVLVALTLTGVLLVLAHGIAASVTDAAQRGTRLSADLDRDANRRLWLQRAFANTLVGSAPVRGFQGLDGTDADHESDRITFFTAVRADTGLVERAIRLWREPAGRLLAELRIPPGPADAVPDTLVLADDLAGFGADYLLDYGASSRWVREWVSPVSAPIAVRLRLEQRDGRADTLLLHIGPRG
jgi:prepilin-type N-terminal cleavage/methylation domain-containing protein